MNALTSIPPWIITTIGINAIIATIIFIIMYGPTFIKEVTAKK